MYPVTSRQIIQNILDHNDPRMLLIVGPCSLHDLTACLEYAKRLKQLADRVVDKFYLIMRVFPEKPRTSLGWKGYISDPYLDGSNCIEEGIDKVRSFMLELCRLQIPIATEILSPFVYLHYQDLLSWSTIGARTVESQIHREIASNLSIPVGFKNNTAGNIDVAINAIQVASSPQTFMGINDRGEIAVINSNGNPYAHLVLRGGTNGSNYSKECINYAQSNIIVDCSHGNSAYDYNQQPKIFADILQQRIDGNTAIVGAMLESFLVPGSQAIPADKKLLKYGCSITDGCMGWEATEELITNAYARLSTTIIRLASLE